MCHMVHLTQVRRKPEKPTVDDGLAEATHSKSANKHGANKQGKCARIYYMFS